MCAAAAATATAHRTGGRAAGLLCTAAARRPQGRLPRCSPVLHPAWEHLFVLLQLMILPRVGLKKADVEQGVLWNQKEQLHLLIHACMFFRQDDHVDVSRSLCDYVDVMLGADSDNLMSPKRLEKVQVID